MKKALFSTLLSALVIPGLGQIINHRPIKGLIILGLVTVLFLGGIFSLYLALVEAMTTQPAGHVHSLSLNLILHEADMIFPVLFGTAFITLWLFSVVDAFRDGRKLEQKENRTANEILSDR
ncbi:MAG: hypothetical protein C4582_03895 [Desulfobacteraceae bacterium]|jgi:TM2 domain-containing membrane protein YozV|nr:MAG: hypothetical protein C4582_03895 [Desulfobacteraceae bacterium]